MLPLIHTTPAYGLERFTSACSHNNDGVCAVASDLAQQILSLPTAPTVCALKGACDACMRLSRPQQYNHVTSSLVCTWSVRTDQPEEVVARVHEATRPLRDKWSPTPQTHVRGIGHVLSRLLAIFGMTKREGCDCQNIANVMSKMGTLWSWWHWRPISHHLFREYRSRYPESRLPTLALCTGAVVLLCLAGFLVPIHDVLRLVAQSHERNHDEF
jgi:hypothetical protein